MDAKTLGQTIRTYRKAASMTQQKLADKAGLHRTYISLIERGKKNPTVQVFFRIAKALGAKPSTVIRNVEMSN